jgi:Zn-finger nucleic acid-binding protein
LSFAIEHCGQCEGVWLDKDEWTALKGRSLHDDLQRICDSRDLSFKDSLWILRRKNVYILPSLNT